MSVTTATTVPAITPFQVDDELVSVSRQLDSALDALLKAKTSGTEEDYDEAVVALRGLSSRQVELESIWERKMWTRFYKDSKGSVHVDRDCYAASAGDLIPLPEMSGRTVASARVMYGTGRTCKKCSHGVD